MPDLTITLSGATAEKLRKLVEEERYASPEEAVSQALDALDESRDPTLDAWLRDTIARRADPTRALSADDVRARVFGR
jgi:Arc/MetJ-type ribon-helix-helix transcriptional regulator